MGSAARGYAEVAGGSRKRRKGENSKIIVPSWMPTTARMIGRYAEPITCPANPGKKAANGP